MKNKQRLKLISNENKILKTAIKINCADCQGYDVNVEGCGITKCPFYPFQIKAYYQKDKKLLKLIDCYRKINNSGEHIDKDYWFKKIQEEILGL